MRRAISFALAENGTAQSLRDFEAEGGAPDRQLRAWPERRRLSQGIDRRTLPWKLDPTRAKMGVMMTDGGQPGREQMTEFLIAESAIRQLQARCVDAIWRKDAKAFADCYTEDGEWKIAGMHLRGRAEIESTFGRLLGVCERVFTILSTPVLEVGQGTAFGRTYVAENSKLTNGQTAHTIGIYFERFVEQADGWKFRWRHWSLQYRGPADLSAPFYPSPDDGAPPGMAGPNDPTTVRGEG